MNYPKTFSLIGAGRVGRALALALAHKGWACQSVISRSIRSAGALARMLNEAPASTDLNELAHARWIFVCCPDDALPAIARAIAHVDFDWQDVTVAHTSGSIGSGVFAAPAAKGAKVCSIHPAISLSGAATDWQKLGKAIFAIEGEPEALTQTRLLIEELGARAFDIPAGGKPAYHLACVLVSNYLVTLHGSAMQIAGGENKMLQQLLVELSRDTLANLSARSPAAALTGPIARGDAGTVAAHLEFLEKDFPDLCDLYLVLGRETLKHVQHTSAEATKWQELARILGSAGVSLRKKAEM